jgi:hypothetical protein
MTRVPPRLRGVRVAYYLGRPTDQWVEALSRPRRLPVDSRAGSSAGR